MSRKDRAVLGSRWSRSPTVNQAVRRRHSCEQTARGNGRVLAVLDERRLNKSSVWTAEKYVHPRTMIMVFIWEKRKDTSRPRRSQPLRLSNPFSEGSRFSSAKDRQPCQPGPARGCVLPFLRVWDYLQLLISVGPCPPVSDMHYLNNEKCSFHLCVLVA